MTGSQGALTLVDRPYRREGYRSYSRTTPAYLGLLPLAPQAHIAIVRLFNAAMTMLPCLCGLLINPVKA